MKVTAAKGLKVPKEENPREYITEKDEVEIDPASHYYISRLTDGELIEVPDAKKAKGGSAGSVSGDQSSK